MSDNPFAPFERDPAVAELQRFKSKLAIPLIDSIRQNPQVPNRQIVRLLRMISGELKCLMSGNLEPFTLDRLLMFHYRWGSLIAVSIDNDDMALSNTAVIRTPKPGTHNGKVRPKPPSKLEKFGLTAKKPKAAKK